jgi:uncharacterized membrane protein (UPF0127 family)
MESLSTMNPNSTSIRRWLVALCAVGSLLALYAGRGHAQTPGAQLEDLSAFPQTTLTISGGGASHQFTIWVANSQAREQQGLMFVRELAADRGMVFVGEAPKVWTMWMRNTYIPLDMLFVAVDGHVVKIAHAIPHDETTISSDIDVNAVIELQAGISDKLHIKVGDVAKWKAVPIASPSG